MGLVGLCWLGLALGGCERNQTREGCQNCSASRNRKQQDGAVAADQRQRTIPDQQSVAGRGMDPKSFNNNGNPYNFDQSKYDVSRPPAQTFDARGTIVQTPPPARGPELTDTGAVPQNTVQGRTTQPAPVELTGMQRTEKQPAVPPHGEVVEVPGSPPPQQMSEDAMRALKPPAQPPASALPPGSAPAPMPEDSGAAPKMPAPAALPPSMGEHGAAAVPPKAPPAPDMPAQGEVPHLTAPSVPEVSGRPSPAPAGGPPADVPPPAMTTPAPTAPTAPSMPDSVAPPKPSGEMPTPLPPG